MLGSAGAALSTATPSVPVGAYLRLRPLPCFQRATTGWCFAFTLTP